MEGRSDESGRTGRGRRGLAVAATLLAIAAAPLALAAGAAPHRSSCDRDVECLTVDVPLDRSGRVPGTVPLHVERLRASGAERGAMILLAGGPGQGSAESFDLGSRDSADFYRSLAPGYTFVAFDSRGTGSSDPLRCPMVKLGFPDDAKKLAACAELLGTRRDFYGTADHAEDLDAVRRALGYGSVAIAGVSYGTQVALAYSLAHPKRVERLLLDSVTAPDLQDPFLAGLFSRMAPTLARFCDRGRCAAATPDFAADVTAVANALAARPMPARVLQPSGRRRTERLDGLHFLSMVFDADLNPGLAAELPALTHAFRAGNRRPLQRVFELLAAKEQELFSDLNVALYVTTICRDGPFPWNARTPLPRRPELLGTTITKLAPGALGPFGRWAADAGVASSCVSWPSPKGGASLGRGPLPDVPVLVLAGGFDLRTPAADGVAVAARFPRGRILHVPGIGHSVLTSDPSDCTATAVRKWLAGRTPATRCARPKAYVAPLGPFPAASAPQPQRPAGARKTLAAVVRTLREAEATWLLTASVTEKRTSLRGLRGGTIVVAADTFELVGYSIEPGVILSGKISVYEIGPPLTFAGVLTVRGPAATRGTVSYSSDSRLRGVFNGRLVAS